MSLNVHSRSNSFRGIAFFDDRECAKRIIVEGYLDFKQNEARANIAN